MYEDFYRNLLANRQAQFFYDALLWQIGKGNTSGTYSLSASDSVSAMRDGFAAIQAVYYDRPECFFLSTESRILLKGAQLTLTNTPKYTPQQIRRIQAQLERTLQQLCADTAGLPQWERERIVYERVAKKLEYKNHKESFDHDIVGPVLQNSGVCEGISNLLTLALRRVGIPCIRVNGERSRENHCWNLVWIDGIPSHVDITWEAVYNREEIGYFWFNLTDPEIRRDHRIKTEGLPMCGNPQFGYHFQTNALFSNVDSAVKELSKRLWCGASVLHARLQGEGNIEQCLKQTIRRAPPAHYRYLCDKNQHAGLLLRTGA